MTKFTGKNRARINQVIAQLKLAVTEDTTRAQLEAVQVAQKALNALEFDLLNGVSQRNSAEKAEEVLNAPGKNTPGK